jgi:signal transduction histidine kinase
MFKILLLVTAILLNIQTANATTAQSDFAANEKIKHLEQQILKLKNDNRVLSIYASSFDSVSKTLVGMVDALIADYETMELTAKGKDNVARSKKAFLNFKNRLSELSKGFGKLK